MASEKLQAGGGGVPMMANPPMAPQSKMQAVSSLTLYGEFPGAPTVEHRRKLYRALTALAERCISSDDTQTAAEILAYLLCQSDMDADTLYRADDLFADLAGRICPRVIYDAREFAADMDLATMVEYLRDVFSPDRN